VAYDDDRPIKLVKAALSAARDLAVLLSPAERGEHLRATPPIATNTLLRDLSLWPL
jgi:hypothetical protein